MKPEYRELIELYLQDSCTEEQLSEILNLLKTDEKFKAELVEAGRIQGLLNAVKHTSYEGLSNRVIRSAGELEQDTLEEQILEKLNLTETVSEKRRSRLTPFLWMAIAAQIAVIFVLLGQKEVQKPVENQALAALYSESGRAWLIRNGEKLPVTAALRLRNGDAIEVEDKGDVTITWNDSTVLHFKDRCDASFNVVEGAKKIDMTSGRVQAIVTKQTPGKPLKINTPNSLVTVIGTKFQLRVNEVESMLEVQRGVVELMRKASGKKVLVNAHEYAVSSPTQEMEVVKVDTPVYRSHEINMDTPDRKVEIVAEINGSRKLYLVVHSGRDGIAFDHAAWLQPRLEDTLGREFSLLNLKWKFADSEWGKTGVGIDAHGDILMYKRLEHIDGIGTHALSVIEYDIPEGYRLFKATGVITDSGANQSRSLSSVVFEVYTEFPEQRYKRIKLSNKGK